MRKTIAIVIADTQRSRLGLPSMIARRLGARSVLEHTLERISRVGQVESIVVVHPPDQTPLALVRSPDTLKPLISFTAAGCEGDINHAARLAGRAWGLHSWRGGIGSATCYDELLPAAPIAAAMKEHQADSALLVGAAWMLVDPKLCEQVLERHLESPDSMQMVFTQSPPGLCGVAVCRAFAEHLAEKSSGFSPVVSYVPSKPQPDPIGLDVCVQINPAVRSAARRFIFDTPRSINLITAITDEAGNKLSEHDAAAVCRLAMQHADAADRLLPQMVTLELTPQRQVHGTLTPHHYVHFDRGPLPLPLAHRIVEQLGEVGDIALTLGGVGDALLHPHWPQIAAAAKEAGVLAVAIETDLLCDEATLGQLLDAPVDVVSIRLNADTAAVYERVMGQDSFARVIANMQWLIGERARRAAAGLAPGRAGLPWIVPRMVKTHDTLKDMETFFDRWVHYLGHAVIEPSTTGRAPHRDLSPALSPVLMAPPRRVACRQLEGRMTIHSNGVVAHCDQDWLGADPTGDAKVTSLGEIWNSLRAARQAHRDGRWNESPLCAGCHEWHRP